MQYQAVFFDLDGTLLDTSKGVIQAVDSIEAEYHLLELTAAEKRSFIGPPIQDSFERHYGLTKAQAWNLATAWRNVYKDKFLLEAVPYEGIYDVLCFCREYGIKTGVATNKREDYTRKLLDHFRFTPLFDCISGTDFEGKSTKADLIKVCMAKCGTEDASKCLMVGDTMNDLEAAKKAAVGFLGVSYGFGFSAQDAQANIPIANDCKAITAFLMGT